ncbi:DUF4365 domain-containing protein [Micromonospora sp. NBRC 101691]|uniref:DUF4365 domain-containing protein n=1 Tax=Micromonospora sp. NBRC 101691 TaxID=3032198 RepID=UPI0024A4F6F5|nr:DUF4365 domain-containing protein [Micromonospora sp. NBRC 101691]GLY23718.1 hypothetical protein Misp04_34500 [Micromonospora sp. NBRC 101691]
MSDIPYSHTTGRNAVNLVRSLLERHGHLVEEKSTNDFGEDLYVELVKNRKRTGITVRVQVKGGRSYRSGVGYRLNIAKWADDWRQGNVPVLIVVHDPDSGRLLWENATKCLRVADWRGRTLKSIWLEKKVLDDNTIDGFTSTVCGYVGRYHGHQAIRARLSDMVGADFEERDRVEYFRNEHDEDLIFWQRPGEDFATLWHSDLGWDPPMRITPDMLSFGLLEGSSEDVAKVLMSKIPADILSALPPDDATRTVSQFAHFFQVPTLAGYFLNSHEASWISACFGATEWMRSGGTSEVPWRMED